MTLGPAVSDERVDQPAIGGADIAVEEGPEMVAAEGLAAFDQQDIHFGAKPGAGECGQCAGEAAAQNREVAVEAFGHPVLLGRAN